MSALSVTQLYDSLSVKLGKETAENLTTFIELKIDKELESKLSMLATKDDLAQAVSSLSTSMNEWRGESKDQFVSLESKMNEWRRESKEDYVRLELKMTGEISRLDSRIDKLELTMKSEFNRLDLRIDHLESTINNRFNDFEKRLMEKLAEYKFETIKWVIGLMLTLASLLFLYLKLAID